MSDEYSDIQLVMNLKAVDNYEGTQDDHVLIVGPRQAVHANSIKTKAKEEF
ncbi:MAG: hypothetical protein ACR2PA_04200 [Hyphomicrobiaceae bacterium]